MARSWNIQKSGKKMTAQFHDLVSLLINKRLKVNAGTQRTSLKCKVVERSTIPTWITGAEVPFGKWTGLFRELELSLEKDWVEKVIWSDALVSITPEELEETKQH